MEHSKHSFHNLDSYIGMQRLSGLQLSADGSRLITSLTSLDQQETGYRSALWELDPNGTNPARRITRGTEGESQAQFTAQGDLLFLAKRSSEKDSKPALWRLPAHGGEAQLVVEHPAGISAVQSLPTAPTSRQDTVILTAQAMPGAADLEQDQALRELRKDKKVNAILHSGYPVRFWDHDLGPDLPSYFSAQLPTESADSADPATAKYLSPGIGAQLLEASMHVAPNGQFLVTDWRTAEGHGSLFMGVTRIDIDTGEREVLLAPDANYEYGVGKISPDSTELVYFRTERSTPQRPGRTTIWLMTLASGEAHQIAVDWDRFATSVTWLPNSTALLLTADDFGRAPIFHLALETDKVTRLTQDGSYTDVVIAPDSSTAYALRASYEYPAEPVRLDLTHLSGLEQGDEVQLTSLNSPLARPELPGRLEEVITTAADGATVRAWLALPAGANPASPAPLLLWVHGGPVSSWNTWSWRWNPWLMVAQGYAVLLPDPGLSTGYGDDFIARGWGKWGAEPYTDLMQITDEVQARADIDQTRTAALGGSFGGYMANWIAGQTDRFKAIVTHASLWDLDGFGPTTDMSFYWAREMQPEMVKKYSPSTYVEQIRTPMLVIHGDKDYRVPIGEGLRLWYELLSKSGLPQQPDGSTPHRFLYFPDENHWILSPQHAKLWYEVILGYLAHHVLGEETELPASLGLSAP